MSTSTLHIPAARLLVLSALAALLLWIPAPAQAQYSIPDCLVATVNGMFPAEVYAAARDRAYKQFSVRWNETTADLTPAQLGEYAAYFCAHVRVSDTGEEANQSRFIIVEWPSVEEYIAATSRTRRSESSLSAEPATENTVSAVMDITNPPSDIGKVLFETQFDQPPTELTLLDADGNVLAPEFSSEGGAHLLHIRSSQLRTLALTGAEAWTDYALEARVRVSNGSLLLATRSGDDACSSYEFYVEPASGYGSLRVADDQCSPELLQDRNGLDIQPGKWMTLRLTTGGNQLTAYVDGSSVLTAIDMRYGHGYPTLVLLPDDGQTATLDVDALRVVVASPPPQFLTRYHGTPDEVIDELRRYGQVPETGGELVAEPQDLSAAGEGAHGGSARTLIDEPQTDLVLAGDLTFRPDDQGGPKEICRLIARGVKTSMGTQIFMIEFDSNAWLVMQEWTGDNNDQLATSREPLFPPGKTYHVLLTLIGPQGILYINGRRTLALDQLDVHAGDFTWFMIGNSPQARCNIDNFWIYKFK